MLGHEIFKRNSMKARMFILILLYSVSWLWCLGWNPEICLGTEEKHDYFLTILVRGTLFVVGVLGIQPKAVGVRQVLHSTARAHLEQDLAPWESSECIGKSPDQYLTYIKGNGFRVAGRLRVRHIWGRTQELCFSLSHVLPVFPFPPLLFSLLRRDLLTGLELRESTCCQVLRLEVCATTLPGTCIPGKLRWSCY